jgi:NAD+ synthase (glutamine-hydrolysing)
LDSSTVALFVYGMAKVVLSSIAAGSNTTLTDLRRVTGIETLVPETPEQIVHLLLMTCYTPTVNSSEETRSRAERLAEKLGARHLSVPIDQLVEASMAIIDKALHFTPKYMIEGGTRSENLALQVCRSVCGNLHGLLMRQEYPSAFTSDYAIHVRSACHHSVEVTKGWIGSSSAH